MIFHKYILSLFKIKKKKNEITNFHFLDNLIEFINELIVICKIMLFIQYMF